jgi:hypothetical protein
VDYLLDIRLQQKEAVAGLTRQGRLRLEAKRERGEPLTEEEAAALAQIDSFDATSH